MIFGDHQALLLRGSAEARVRAALVLPSLLAATLRLRDRDPDRIASKVVLALSVAPVPATREPQCGDVA